VIITGGRNVYSAEVEQVIANHPEVIDVAVIGRPDPEWGETVVAFITAVDGSDLTPACYGSTAPLGSRTTRFLVSSLLRSSREMGPERSKNTCCETDRA